MEHAKDDNIIPVQQEGSSTDIESTIEGETLHEAQQLFQISKQRLLDVNNWHNLCSMATATFKLTDKNGTEVNRTAEVGDHFKIDIPGPGTVSGDGFDWVQIEAIEEQNDAENDMAAIRVRPAVNPLGNKKDVSHFFTDDATSSFIVTRSVTKITAAVRGRNEKANTNTKGLVDKTRNAMIAVGAMLGFSAIQWKNLVTGLLHK